MFFACLEVACAEIIMTLFDALETRLRLAYFLNLSHESSVEFWLFPFELRVCKSYVWESCGKYMPFLEKKKKKNIYKYCK